MNKELRELLKRNDELVDQIDQLIIETHRSGVEQFRKTWPPEAVEELLYHPGQLPYSISAYLSTDGDWNTPFSEVDSNCREQFALEEFAFRKLNEPNWENERCIVCHERREIGPTRHCQSCENGVIARELNYSTAPLVVDPSTASLVVDGIGYEPRDHKLSIAQLLPLIG